MMGCESELGTTRFLSLCLQTSLLLMSIFHTGISSVKGIAGTYVLTPPQEVAPIKIANAAEVIRKLAIFIGATAAALAALKNRQSVAAVALIPDVRCYCNLPACVTSGYMCKSSVGVCVSDHFGFNGDIWQSRHTCLELLADEPKQMKPLECPQNFPDVVLDSGKFPARFCCKEDMCNYFRNAVDKQDPVYRLNHSYMTGYLSNDDYFYRHGGHNKNNDTSVHQQMWFKAAVIAVPIAGGCILIMLIIMAAKMLKADYKRHREWTEFRRRHRLNTHVVYTGEKSISRSLFFLPKSVSCAVLGSDSNYRHPQLHKSYASVGSIGQPNNLYKNVSIALSTDTGCTDGSRDKYFVFDL